MKRSVLFKRISLYFFVTVQLQQLSAQTTSITYHELASVSFRNPVLIGKTDNGYALMDAPGAEGAPVYFIDTSLQITRKLFIPIPTYGANGYTTGNCLRFIWQERSADSIKIKLVQATEDGNITTIERKFLAPGASRIYQQMVSDRKNQRFFYHTWFVNAEQLVLKGILLDSSLTPIKEINSRFVYDSSLQRQTQALLDVNGNLHVALYDKLSNYRLSANIHLHTIPYGTDRAVSETLQFNKTKFYDLIFFDNPVTDDVQLAGFYYDGATKIKTGLASIRFPYERKKPIHENFILFSEAQRIKMLQGVGYVRRKHDIMDFVKLRDIIEEDGKVFLSAWILDIPNHLLVKDYEQEKMRNTTVMDWLRLENLVNTNMRRYPNSTQRNRMASDPLALTQNTAGTRSGGAGSPFNSNMLVNWINPKKIAFFSLNTDSSMWMQVVPGNFPVTSVSYQSVIWNYPLVEKDQLYFMHLQQMETKNKTGSQANTTIPVVSVINITSNGTSVTTDTSMNLSQFRLGLPLKIKTGKYLLPYRHLEKNENGLAVLEIKQ